MSGNAYSWLGAEAIFWLILLATFATILMSGYDPVHAAKTSASLDKGTDGGDEQISGFTLTIALLAAESGAMLMATGCCMDAARRSGGADASLWSQALVQFALAWICFLVFSCNGDLRRHVAIRRTTLAITVLSAIAMAAPFVSQLLGA